MCAHVSGRDHHVGSFESRVLSVEFGAWCSMASAGGSTAIACYNGYASAYTCHCHCPSWSRQRGGIYSVWSVTRSNRNLLDGRYSSTFSTAIQRRCSFSATAPVVLEPAKGSSIISSSDVSSLRKNSGR